IYSISYRGFPSKVRFSPLKRENLDWISTGFSRRMFYVYGALPLFSLTSKSSLKNRRGLPSLNIVRLRCYVSHFNKIPRFVGENFTAPQISYRSSWEAGNLQVSRRFSIPDCCPEVVLVSSPTLFYLHRAIFNLAKNERIWIGSAQDFRGECSTSTALSFVLVNFEVVFENRRGLPSLIIVRLRCYVSHFNKIPRFVGENFTAPQISYRSSWEAGNLQVSRRFSIPDCCPEVVLVSSPTLYYLHRAIFNLAKYLVRNTLPIHGRRIREVGSSRFGYILSLISTALFGYTCDNP
ncbi:hypothetical protein GE061_018262, partial [Apolygus lucorum]